MSKYRSTQTLYSEDGESSIFAEAGIGKFVAILVSSQSHSVEIELKAELIIKFAKNLIELAGGEYEQN